MSFKSVDTAYAVRQAMETLAKELLGRERPEPRYGTVESISLWNRTCQVVLQGDTAPVKVRCYRVAQPTAVGDVVRVEGKPGNLYVTEVIVGRPMSMQAVAYEPTVATSNSYDMNNTALQNVPRRVKYTWAEEFPGAIGVNNTLHLGRWYSPNWEIGVAQAQTLLELTITGRGYGAVVKKYEIALSTFGPNTNSWEKLAPTQGTDSQLGNNFEVEIYTDNSDNSFQLRIRETADYGGRGWRVVLESTGAADMAYDGSYEGVITTAPAAPTTVYESSNGYGSTRLGGSAAQFLPTRDQFLLSGGGIIDWDGANLYWGTRFIAMGHGRHTLSTVGYFDITCPTSGTIPVIGGSVGSVTATGSGIPLSGWQALYYRLPYGGGNGVVAGNFYIYDYTNDVGANSTYGPPTDAILIAVRNNDGGPSLKLGTGEIRDHWRAPSFQNSWVNYGSPYPTAAYRMEANNVVRLKGLVKLGTMGAAIFTLPAKYRPTERFLLSTIVNANVAGRIDVDTTGTVTPTSATGTNGWVALDGLTFVAGA